MTDHIEPLNFLTETITIQVIQLGFIDRSTYQADLNKDRIVNILDITIVAAAYNTRPGDSKWNELADLDKNNNINILDISMVARDYGKTV